MFNKVSNIFQAEGNKTDDKKQDESNDKSVFNNFVEKAQMLKKDAEEKLIKVQDEAKNTLKQIDQSLQKGILAQKLSINIWLRRKIQDTILNLLQKSRQNVKDALKDPDMCNCVKNAVDDGVDTSWPIIMEDVKFRLQMAIEEPYVEVQQSERLCLLKPICFLRDKFVYANYPYDMTIWKQMKQFWWWFFTIISSFPFFGVQPLFYAIDFVCIDKSDEYQLVQFILNYKKMLFFTQGCVNGIIGYILYYFCVSLNSNGQVYQQCFSQGPGSQMKYLYDLVVFLLQIVLVWFAYFLLPCSQQKGKPKFKYNEKDQIIESAPEGCGCNCERGGILHMLMIWDLLSFGAAAAIFILSMISQQPYSGNSSSDMYLMGNPYLYFAYIVYGLLSFPFLIFSVGPIANMLTKSRPTAYDKYGNTVPFRPDIKINYNKQDPELEKIISIDIEEMFH